MKIANILSNNDVKAPIEFNVVNTLDEIINGLPTLIVGYDYVNKAFPDFDITNNKLADNLYWTFKRTEKRDKYEEDLNWFIKKAYLSLVKDVLYISIDPIQHRPKTLFKIVRKLYSIENKVAYLDGNMVFIYGDKIIFGVDLELFKFVGFDIDKIKNKIKDNSTHFLDKNSIFIEYKKVIQLLDDKVMYIPYLAYLKNEENNPNSLVYIPRKN